MLQRNLLYTGVTRGKRLVVLVGKKGRRHRGAQRLGPEAWSKLAEWLNAQVSKRDVTA